MRRMYQFVFLIIVWRLIVSPVWAQHPHLLVSSGSIFTKQMRAEIVGIVEGRVFDVSNNHSLPKVDIEVVGEGLMTQTDLDGNFTVQLKPGSYQLRASHDGYQSQVIENVAVPAKEVVALDFALSPQGQVLGEVEVKASSSGVATEIAMLAERRAATSLNDALSVREISQITSSNAAGVLAKVPGISVAKEKFVYVRGLNERYSNTVLNEAMLPTTEPDRRVVPMDLIPASLLDNVKVLKSFYSGSARRVFWWFGENSSDGISQPRNVESIHVVWF